MSRVYARPAGLIKMDKLEIDEYAWKNQPLPKEAGRIDQIYYHLARSIYGYVKSGTMELQQAKNLKLTLAHYFETVEMLARSSGRLLVELGKLTAPWAELRDKPKDELEDIILKMRDLCCGLTKSAEEVMDDLSEEEVNNGSHK